MPQFNPCPLKSKYSHSKEATDFKPFTVMGTIILWTKIAAAAVAEWFRAPAQ